MKPKKVLTKYQEDFIEENYLIMTDEEMGKEIGLKVPFLLAYRATKGFYKRKKYSAPVIMKGDFFNVEEKWNWAI